jgi:hypothetical protein
MTAYLRFLRAAFVLALMAAAALCFAADAADASPGSRTHATTEQSTSAAAVPDSSTEATEVSDPAHEAEQLAYRDYQRSVLAALSASAEPRDWALAGQMFLFTEKSAIYPDRHNELVLRAAKAAPNDALVQWLAALSAPNDNGSAISAADNPIDALLTIEQDNAAAWQQALMQALRNKNDSRIDEALAGMASSRRYDDHFGDVLRAWLDVYERHPMPDDLVQRSSHEPSFAKETAALAGAMAQTTATNMPNYSAITKVCRIDSPEPQSWTRNAYCAEIGHLMATSAPTVLSRKMGYAVLHLSGNVSENDVQEARNLDWLWHQEYALVDDEKISPAYFAAQANDWRTSVDEIEVLRRGIMRAGISLTPPPEWISPRPLVASPGYMASQ